MKPKITIFSDSVGSGKTTFLQEELVNLPGVAGVLSPEHNGKRYFQLIPSEELLPMESESGSLVVGRFQFDAQNFQKVAKALWDFWKDPSIKTLLIDEIGPLEIKKKQGFHELLVRICHDDHVSQKEIIVVVRDYCIQDFIRLYGLDDVRVKTKNDFYKSASDRPIGVVLCGGKSKRMKTDKAFLQYNGLPQWEYVYNLLSPFCEKTLLSVNTEQQETGMFPKHIEQILDKDEYKEHGPMTGLMSVLEAVGDKPIFLIACDYPLLRMEHLLELIKHRNTEFDVVCYRNTGRAEPLITLFEASVFEQIQAFYKEGNDSIATFIKQAKTCFVDVSEADFLQNVNDPEAFQRLNKSKND